MVYPFGFLFFNPLKHLWWIQIGIGHSVDWYSGLNLNQDKATKPQAVQIVRQGEATQRNATQRRTGLKLIHYGAAGQRNHVEVV